MKRIARIKQFVCARDLLLLIEKLMAIKKRRVVHFALDLYIILLCGQRFLADHARIENGIKLLLEENIKNNDKLLCNFPMIIGKTNTPQDVCLNRQLVLLLMKF